MPKDDHPTIRRHARDAIDRDTLARLLETAADHDCDDGAVEALREVTADVAAVIAAEAAARARYRLRPVEADDVATVFEDLCDCCDGSGDLDQKVLYFTYWEN